MSVKTTVELPEGLVSEAKRKALDESTTLRELVIRGLEMVLYPKSKDMVSESPSTVAYGQTYQVDDAGWPVLQSDENAVQITDEMVNEMREELGI